MKKIKKTTLTKAQQYGGKGQILNERPEGMSYEEYRLKRRLQTKAIKNLLR